MKRSSPQPRVLGEDGKFQLIQNAMGVPGFHVAINPFTATTHQQLFSNRESFEIDPQPFVKDQAVPIQQTIFHPLMSGGNGPWPDNFHRIIHSVRDCGLFPQATIPDNSYGLTIPSPHSFLHIRIFHAIMIVETNGESMLFAAL